MELSELVHFKNQLDALSTHDAQTFLKLEIGKIIHLADSYSDVAQFNNDLSDQFTEIQKSINKFDVSVNTLKRNVKLAIEEAEKVWFQRSYDLCSYESFHQSDYILDFRTRANIDLKFFESRLIKHADWHHPAMIIRPGRELFIDHMVACDPLYLVDMSHDFLAPALTKFNKQYQNRLRPYRIKEDPDQEILGKLPNNQFGVCFAYNYFDFRPFETLKKYLVEIYQKLKPGGTLIMTFNDCDRASAVKLVEKYFCCYTPGYLVRELAISIGYKIDFEWSDDGPITWLELVKPGVLTSLRGGQSLAKIIQDEEILFQRTKN